MSKPRTYADLGADLFAEVIAADFRSEVEDLTVWRRRWRKVANVLESLAVALGVLSAIFAFAAGFFKILPLSFVAGLLMSVSTGLTAYSKYANHESSERTAALNRLLPMAGITPEPDLVVDDLPPAAPPAAPSVASPAAPSVASPAAPSVASPAAPSVASPAAPAAAPAATPTTNSAETAPAAAPAVPVTAPATAPVAPPIGPDLEGKEDDSLVAALGSAPVETRAPLPVSTL